MFAAVTAAAVTGIQGECNYRPQQLLQHEKRITKDRNHIS